MYTYGCSPSNDEYPLRELVGREFLASDSCYLAAEPYHMYIHSYQGLATRNSMFERYLENF